MSKIAVIGTAGGGKSTLCRELQQILEIPIFQMDKIQWLPGWKCARNVDVDAAHDRILRENHRWIIDGFGTHRSIDARFAAADTIIIVNHSIWRHYWWTLKRQLIGLLRHNPDLPEGCTIGTLWGLVFRGVRKVHYGFMPDLVRRAALHSSHARVFHIRSPGQLAGVLSAARASLTSD